MTMERSKWIDQAHMSGLAIEPTKNAPPNAKWTTQSQCSMKHGSRDGHASVVLKDCTVVVMGGLLIGGKTTTVILLCPLSQTWRDGPRLTRSRQDMTAIVCNEYVYAIGGVGQSTIERIHVDALMTTTALATTTTRLSHNNNNNNNNENNNENQYEWEVLNARLSSPREGCAVVAIHNRFLVVLGGHHCGQDLSSVDIVDTMPFTTTTTKTMNGIQPSSPPRATYVTITAGPAMNSPRRWLGAAVLDNQIWIVGGRNGRMADNTVESIPFSALENKNFPHDHHHQYQDDDDDNNNNNNHEDWSLFSSSSTSTMSSMSQWTKHPQLSLYGGRYGHSVCVMGDCIVVAGGGD